jgi:hypothetical protein
MRSFDISIIVAVSVLQNGGWQATRRNEAVTNGGNLRGLAAAAHTSACEPKFAAERVLPPDMPHAVLAEQHLSRVTHVTGYGSALRGAPGPASPGQPSISARTQPCA